jgi:hypothetical protein
MACIIRVPVSQYDYSNRWQTGHQYGYQNDDCRFIVHRENDLPAVVYTDGTKTWYFHGETHRDDDKPAYMGSNGDKIWFQFGKRYRKGNQPAAILKHGTRKEWYDKDGKLHRDGGRPAVKIRNGTDDKVDEYWIHGKQHRDGDRPAVVHGDGKCEYWKHGQRHRGGDQPAVIRTSPSDLAYFPQAEWWVYGVEHRVGYKPAVMFANGKEIYYVRGVYLRARQINQFVAMKKLRIKLLKRRKRLFPWITNWRRLCKFTDLINSPEYNHWRYKPDTHLPLQQTLRGKKRKRNRPTTGGLDDDDE